jgi:hypothetical protein
VVADGESATLAGFDRGSATLQTKRATHRRRPFSSAARMRRRAVDDQDFFEARFLVARLADFLAARFFGAARFFVDFLAARFFVARFLVAFFAARFFGAARFFVAFFAARFLVALRLVVFLAADFFGAALRFFAFFFGAAAGAEGVIIDIMSAIIVDSPV